VIAGELVIESFYSYWSLVCESTWLQ